jgi:hypothetical protein
MIKGRRRGLFYSLAPVSGTGNGLVRGRTQAHPQNQLQVYAASKAYH